MSDIQRLLDIEAIKQLKARYFRSMDTKDWSGFGAVFTHDVHVVVPEGDMDITGRDAAVAAISGALTGVQTVHHGHMPEIEITGTDTASGIWAMEDYVEFAGANGARAGLRGYGHYHERYHRDAGGWLIAELRLSRIRVDPLS
ncbi:MAG: nuclear transport factor 2 family protein [Acidimicrobiales bacterium]